MMSKKIQIITEGGIEFGFGHITRCISLVQGFSDFKSEFIIHGDRSVLNSLSQYNTKLLNWHEKEEELLLNLCADIFLIDSLNIRTEHLKKIEELNIPIIFFDDEERKNILNKGYVLDWTILSDEKEFFFPRKENVKYILGAQYTSLRKSFLLSTSSELNKDIKKILVSFGGADVRNLTPKILNFLTCYYPMLEKNIVIGPGFNNIDEIEELKDDNTNLLYNLNENEMCYHMKNSDIAISAGGQTLYELARLGIPTISPLLVENARDDTFGWRDVGFLRYIGMYDDKKLLDNLSKELEYLQSFFRRKEVREKAFKYINLAKESKITNIVLKDLYGAI